MANKNKVTKAQMEWLVANHANKVEEAETRKKIAAELTEDYKDTFPTIENYIKDVCGLDVKIKMGVIPVNHTEDGRGFKVLVNNPHSKLDTYFPVLLCRVNEVMTVDNVPIEKAIVRCMFEYIANSDMCCMYVDDNEYVPDEICTCNICAFSAKMALQKNQEDK